MAINLSGVMDAHSLVIVGGAGPITSAYVPLEPGLTALYGPNGAGKTFTLDALAACLSGLVPARLADTRIGLVVRIRVDGLRTLLDAIGDQEEGLETVWEGDPDSARDATLPA